MAVCPACGAANEEAARFCSRCGSALAKAGAPEEVRKTVTTLFADVAGSTAVGERLDPESLRRVMTRHFDEIRRIVEEHGGLVEKFIGDAVMAVFGVPKVHEDDALRAVRAAVAARDRLTELDAELRDQLGVSIGWRIGVNTGEVVAGDAGAGQRFVTGDAVNLAKRLEEAAGTGEVVIGGATHRLVRDAVSVEPLEPLMVKGKAEPVDAYRLLRIAPGVIGPARRADAAMVGRVRQRRQLTDAFAQAAADRVCHLFTILGAAGVGKSRLMNEFLSSLDANVRVLRGRCLSYGHGITFWPIREMVHQAAQITDDDAPELARTKLAALLAGADEVERIVDRVGEAVGLLEATPMPEEIFWAIRRLFETLAEHHPLVLLFDDVQWAEPTLLDLIEHVADWTRDAPILLVCLARQDLLEARPAWAGGKLAATTIQLEPLTSAESEELVANLLGQAELQLDARQRIAEAADGNPLFVEELLAMLIDDESLVRDDGKWLAAGDLRNMAVPPTIQALLAARLDRLARPERAVMECGSVEGKVFHAGAVRALVPDAVRPQVPSHLMALMRKELLRPERAEFSGDEAYRFRHLLIRDAAYQAMPKQARAELHERFATWLEEVAGERKTEYDEILAHHLEQAYRYRLELATPAAEVKDVARRAADYLARSGDRAVDRGDFHAARRLLESALELIDDDPRRPHVLERLGAALFGQYELRAARERAEEAVELYRERADPVPVARAEVLLLDIRNSLERLEVSDVIARGEELAAFLDDAGDVRGWAAASIIVGQHLFFSGRATDAERYLTEALPRVPAGSRERAELTHWLIAALHWGPASAETAIPRIEQLIAENPGVRRIEGSALRHAAALHAMQGRFDEARAMTARSYEIAQEMGHGRATLSSGGHFLAPLERLAGDPKRAVEVGRPSYEAMAATGDQAFSSTAAGIVALALTDLGRWDEAEHYATIARETAASDDNESQSLGRQGQALVLAHRGELPEAERLAREAVGIRSRGDQINGHADALADLATVLRLAGKHGGARDALREALELYLRKGNLVSARRTEELMAEVGTRGDNAAGR